MKRTNIEINDQIVDALKKETGLKTSKDVVNYSLETTLRLSKQKRIFKLFGTARRSKNYWNLSEWRKGRLQ